MSLKTYFPDAEIVGAELSDHRLKLCRERMSDSSISFIKSSDTNIQRMAPYSAIFAMAVLLRTPHKVANDGVKNLSSIYHFSKFEDQVKKFDSYLLPGGLIVIQYSQYRFSDTTIAERYEVCGRTTNQETPAMFDPNGDLLVSEPYDEIVFRKIR